MRVVLAAVLVAMTLFAAPAYAKGSPGFFASIPHNFMTGANHYFSTVGGWIESLLELLGLSEKLRIAAEGESCTSATRCAIGLVCVNVCTDAECDLFEKRCAKGPSRVQVLGEFSGCDGDDLCADGTLCTRTCPRGETCAAGSHRCMRPVEPAGSCSAAADCVATCAALPFPPIGTSGWLASCAQGSCRCAPVETRPDAARVVCPEGLGGAIACPAGTRSACTQGAHGPYLTCLTAPSYGGTCFTDAGCAEATCAEGAMPFCDMTEQVCKCRSSETQALTCATVADCAAAAACAEGEVAACIDGACACAQGGVTAACSTPADCAACQEDFSPVCQEGQCGCQRVTENVPVACAAVEDCGGVSCPAGFDKACIDAKCACTRTVIQE